jgi:3-phosphoshikimate 1-carboxyvinyltransferase
MGDRVSWTFVGSVPASKSILNRLLLVQSYFPQFRIHGNSRADDVGLMTEAVAFVQAGRRTLECGLAGTVFRFIALRCARAGGEWQLNMTPALKRRPHDELIHILQQLSCEHEWNETGLKIRSRGWQLQGDALHVKAEKTSQFLTGVLLNSWNLEQPLFVSIRSLEKSKSYFQMSLRLAENLGLRFQLQQNELTIFPSKLSAKEWTAEPDMSSAFALAAIAAVRGGAQILNFPQLSLQPDAVFPEILQRMNVTCVNENSKLKINASAQLRGLVCDLSQTPDLFPSLAALCVLAEGDSKLIGASQLVHKESNRIAETTRLLRPLGRTLIARPDGIEVSGSIKQPEDVDPWTFDPKHDHRMAMAAAVLMAAGYRVRVLTPEVVNKSFPEFWQAIGILP